MMKSSGVDHCPSSSVALPRRRPMPPGYKQRISFILSVEECVIEKDLQAFLSELIRGRSS